MTTPWPGVIPGQDVSLAAVADLKLAKGGEALEAELERPRYRRRGRGLQAYRRIGRNAPDPRDTRILSAREVERIKRGVFSD